MKLSVDAQPLIDRKKSGIGYYGHSIVKELSKIPGIEQTLEIFAFRHSADKISRVQQYCDGSVNYIACRWFSMRAYLMLTMVFPIPRSFFFRNRPDVSFYFNYIVPPGVRGKKIVVVHDMVIRDCPETASTNTKIVLKLFLKRSLKRADMIATVSEFSRQRIMHYYDVPSEKICVIPCGVDTEIYKPADDSSAAKSVCMKFGISGDYILYLGTLEPRKNILRLVKAYKEFSDKTANAPLLVLAGGKGWQFDEIFEYVEENDLNDRVIFTGYVTDEEKIELLRGALLFCFPSLYEGFGMPILEAMACGTPVLTSNVASMPEIGGNACDYCDPLSVEDIARGLDRLWNDPQRRKTLSELGMFRAHEFSWSVSAEKLNAVFKEIVK